MNAVVGHGHLLTSTEAARCVRTRPSDPLFLRFDQLRAAGKLRPVTLEPVPLYDPADVDRAARPWLYLQADGEPAERVWREVIGAVAVAAAVWGAFGTVAWAVLR